MDAENPHHPLPGRLAALVFAMKTRVLQLQRTLRDLRAPVRRHPRGNRFAGTVVIADLRTELWNQTSDAEFVLKAGKVQNLRAACRLLDGTEILAGEIFSFWKQLGRTTRRAGYTTGRELRSGCLVPNLGGGLCALSGLLYEAALKSGCEITERHGHSKILPGMTADPSRDATIFWNYVDLRFRVPCDTRIEARLDRTHLIVRFHGGKNSAASRAATPAPARDHVTGDCLTCGETQCFRHPSAKAAHPPQEAHTAWLLDGVTPEFNDFCVQNSKAGDQWFIPLDAARWKKSNYAWTPPADASVRFATLRTLLSSWRSRRLPQQGALRQKTQLTSEKQLAEFYAKHLSPCAGHLVISQNLLPHLWQLGALGGRTFDVLGQRLSLGELHATLDQAAASHPESKTLADYRADEALAIAETAALKAARKILTPHRDLARRSGSHAVLLDWHFPASIAIRPSPSRQVFLPCSALARKGIHELAAALNGSGIELIILGGATETGSDPLKNIPHRRGGIDDLKNSAALVLPAWVEHQPRLALLALASGIPVIATRACGLPEHPLLHEIPSPDVLAIRSALDTLFARAPLLAAV